MYVNFHKRPEKIPLKGWMTSVKFAKISLFVSNPPLEQSEEIVRRRNLRPNRNHPVNQARNGSGHENGADFER
jgi:hypothetical protein